jgi:hypothetical protein
MSSRTMSRLAAIYTIAALTVVVSAARGDPRSDWNYVLRSMEQERLKLKSGKCRIKGALTTREGTWNSVRDFVFDGVKVYFERTEPFRIAVLDKTQPDPDKPGQFRMVTKTEILTIKYCSNGKKAGLWRIDHPILSIVAAKPGLAPPAPHTIGFLDPRALGLYQIVSLKAEYDFEKVLEGYSTNNWPPDDLEKPDRGPWCAIWISKFKKVTFDNRLWVDVKNGFTPVRFQQKKFANDPESAIVVQDAQTKWEKRDGLWIPVHMEISSGVSEYSINTFELDWSKVNEPMNAGLFEWQAFGAPDKVMVVDSSTGKNIVIRQGFGLGGAAK